MRIVICVRCKAKLNTQADYANVQVGPDKFDLCYEKCYQHYEALILAEDELAATTHKELVESRRELYKRFSFDSEQEQNGQPSYFRIKA